MPTRRRFISITAAYAGMAAFATARAAAAATSVWKGVAMGATASMTLVHPDGTRARALIQDCVAEIERLEAIFSLYRPDSALTRLNTEGELSAPPHELVELMSFALSLSQRSAGAFDPTVQPLYRLYADHFGVPGAAPRGPSPRAIARVLRSVDFTAVEVSAGRIRLRRSGMAITLNGIAQGFLTDRVADRLRAGGLEDVLIDLGEIRALGHGQGGKSWRAGIADPRQPTRCLLELPLGQDRGELPALATSAGYGTCFGPDPGIHHLLDPHTGRSANHHASVSVAAPRATLADGLSTTLSVVAPERVGALLDAYRGTRVYLVDSHGRVAVRDAPDPPAGPAAAPAGRRKERRG